MSIASRQSLWNSSGLLPSDYKELQWVDCDTQDRGSGTAWGAYAKTDISNLTRDSLELETTCIRTKAIGGWNFLCGCEYTDNETGYIKIRLYGGPNPEVWEHNTGSSDNSPCPISEVQNVRIKNRVATVNSYSWQVLSSTAVNQHYFCIGGAETVTYRFDGYQRVWPGYIGRTKVSQNGVLRGDFVPAKRKSDGVCGFYDLVSKNFYTSATPVPFKEA